MDNPKIHLPSLHSEFTVLRTEQDREYQDAVEADLRFRELKDCEETAQALLIQEKQNQMEHQRDMELLKLNCRDVYLQHTRNSLETEPEFESNDVITIRFMLPRKERISRRFVKTDKIQVNSCSKYFSPINTVIRPLSFDFVRKYKTIWRFTSQTTKWMISGASR